VEVLEAMGEVVGLFGDEVDYFGAAVAEASGGEVREGLRSLRL